MSLALLPGERRLASFRPHPFSFLPAQLVALLPAAWAGATAWLVRTQRWDSVWGKLDWLPGDPETMAGYILLGAGLLILSAAVAVVRIKWGTWFLHAAAALGAIFVGHFALDGDHRTLAPLLLAASSLLFLLVAELDRLRHSYILTNFRIIFAGGAFRHKERQLRYGSVTDLDSQQGPLGRVFGFGTIIPITQSGFGLGDDSSQANIGIGAVSKRGPAIGVSAGGGRSVQVGRARTFHQLTGAHPFRKIKRILEEQLHAGSETTLLQRQIDLQQQTMDLMRQQRGPAAAPAVRPASPAGTRPGPVRSGPAAPPRRP